MTMNLVPALLFLILWTVNKKTQNYMHLFFNVYTGEGGE